MEDVVIEIKIRLGGVSYDEAQLIRDALRDRNDISMVAIADELRTLANEIAPEAKIEIFNPWAEWRPAQGRRQRVMKLNKIKQDHS